MYMSLNGEGTHYDGKRTDFQIRPRFLNFCMDKGSSKYKVSVKFSSINMGSTLRFPNIPAHTLIF